MEVNSEMKNLILNFVKDETKYFKKTNDLKIKEIGDGNINYIYKVYNSNQSMIVKFSDDHVRSNAKRKLSSARNKIECKILKKQYKLSNGLVPKVYGFSDKKKMIAMEDLTDYQVLRTALKEKKVFPNFSKSMAKFLYDTLFKTTDLVLGSKQKKNNVKKFMNYDMCEISERLVFTEPYLNIQGFNSYTKENASFIEKNIYKNTDLHSEVAKLKLIFMSSSESMIHGDLHSGSIFINENGIKVFDPEFAFYGPMGYDIGNIIASSLITAVVNDFENKSVKSEFSDWIKKAIVEIIDEFINLYQKNYNQNVSTPIFKNEIFKNYYLQKILNETAGYAGTEILRRTIGVAKVLDIDRIKDKKDYHFIEKHLIKIASELIMERDKFTNGEKYKKLFRIEEV